MEETKLTKEQQAAVDAAVLQLASAKNAIKHLKDELDKIENVVQDAYNLLCEHLPQTFTIKPQQ